MCTFAFIDCLDQVRCGVHVHMHFVLGSKGTVQFIFSLSVNTSTWRIFFGNVSAGTSSQHITIVCVVNCKYYRGHDRLWSVVHDAHYNTENLRWNPVSLMQDLPLLSMEPRSCLRQKQNCRGYNICASTPTPRNKTCMADVLLFINMQTCTNLIISNYNWVLP